VCLVQRMGVCQWCDNDSLYSGRLYSEEVVCIVVLRRV
jgi:hypothetical protein